MRFFVLLLAVLLLFSTPAAAPLITKEGCLRTARDLDRQLTEYNTTSSANLLKNIQTYKWIKEQQKVFAWGCISSLCCQEYYDHEPKPTSHLESVTEAIRICHR